MHQLECGLVYISKGRGARTAQGNWKIVCNRRVAEVEAIERKGWIWKGSLERSSWLYFFIIIIFHHNITPVKEAVFDAVKKPELKMSTSPVTVK